MVKSINDSAFAGCSGLTSVTIMSNVVNISGRTFYGCTELKAFIVNTTNTNYATIDGVLFNKSLCNLIAYPKGKSSIYRIPNSATSIGSSAFAGSTGLTSVTIPDSVTDIGDVAFHGCSNLSEVICMSSNPPKSLYSDIFDYNTYDNGILYVPIGSANLYATKSPWSSFHNIIEKNITGIKPINKELNIYISDKSIIVESDNCNVHNINVYSHDGVLVKSITTEKKHTEIPLNKSGMYIVKTNSGTQKVIVK